MTLGETTVVVGGYTTSDDSAGLTAFRIEPGRATVDVVELPALDAESPSFLVNHPNGRWFYAVTENTDSEILFFSVERNALRRMGSTPTSAAGACHLALTEDGQHLIVAHYMDGLVTSHRIDASGAPGPALDIHRFSGSGPHPERQAMPHAHQVVPFGSELLVADLGTDRIHRLSLDRNGHFVVPGAPIQLPAGSGPRHLVVDSTDRLIVACELSAQVMVVRHDGKEWQVRDVASTSTTTRPCQPSAIRLREDDVFVANRGPDTFSVLDLDRDNDTITLLTEVPTGGRWPRDLVVVDEQVWIACQRSHVISVFRDVADLDDELGEFDEDLEWRLDFQISTRSPACLVVQPQR